MAWIDREETVRNLLAARRELKRRQATVAECRATYKAALRSAKIAADRVETAFASLEAKQGLLPFDDGSADQAGSSSSPQPVGGRA
jgi:hypothetical protein